MKIAIFTDGIWPFVIGGMQKHSYYLCKYLSRNGVYIDLYHTSLSERDIDLKKWFSLEEMKYINAYFISFPKSDKLPGNYLRASYKYSKNIFEIYQKNPPVDLIYAKGLTSWYLLKNRKMPQDKTPVCINVHGYEYFQKPASLGEWLMQLMLRPAFRLINRRADYIYSYGGEITSIIKKYIPNRNGMIVEIPAAIEHLYINESELKVHNPRKFLFVGRFERRKGIQELLSAFKQLQSDRKYQLHIIGDIPEREKFKSPFIYYHGLVKDVSLMMEHLKSADILVCPSYAEGMPNVILEAMASGCAVIASNVGAVSLMVNSNTGWLIKPGSVDAITIAIGEALTISSSTLIEKRKYSIGVVRNNFLWDHVIVRTIDSFKQVVVNNQKKINQ